MAGNARDKLSTRSLAMRRGGSPHTASEAPGRARRDGDESAFLAWWRSDAQAAETRAAALAAFRKRKCAKLGDACCAACAALYSAEQHEAAAAEAAANALTPDALSAWRDTFRTAAAAADPEAAGICGPWESKNRSRAGKERACGLWTSLELSPGALAAHAELPGDAASEPLLEWPSVEAFTDALDRYLKDRLLCKVRPRNGSGLTLRSRLGPLLFLTTFCSRTAA